MKLTISIALVLTSLWAAFNAIGTRNEVVKKARNAYTENRFKEAQQLLKALTDSLDVDNNTVALNYAHSNFILAGYSTMRPADSVLIALDSTQQLEYELCFEMYMDLTDSDDTEIASIAYNQAGCIAFIKKDIKKPEEGIDQSILFFKRAIEKDNNNKTARYNYELLKTYKDYPAKLLNQAKQLVRNKRYKQAYNLMQKAGDKDPRILKNTDFMTRLKSIIQIDDLQK